MNGDLTITDEDVYLVTGIPMGPLDINPVGRERVKMEKHDANCFGEGRVEDIFVYKPPVSETDKRVDDAVTTQGKENVEGLWSDNKGKGKDCYGAFSKAIMQAKFVVPHMEAVTKISTLADSLFEGFSLSQQSKEESEMEEEERKDEEKDDHGLEQDERNDEGTVEDKFDKVKEKDDHEMEEEERKDESKVEEGKKYVDYMDSDEFYNDPNILADLEGILNSAYNRVGEAFKEHQVTKEKMDKELMEGPSFSLFHGEDALYTSQEFREAQRPGDMCDVPHASTSTAPVIPSPPRATMSATPSIPSPPRGSTPAAPSIHSPPRASTSAAPSNPSPASPILISSQLSLNESPIMPSSPLVKLSPTVPSQTRKCKRKVELPDVFRSPFFIRNVNVMDALSQSEKLMGDYAFAADLDEGEVLFSRGGKILTRYDMKTLLFGGSVNIDVINVWCDYLNNGNRLRDRRSISRLFLTETTDIASLDINYRDVKLVLFPVVAPSPLLHCFDIDHNLYEVIHPCDPGCVDFHASVQYVVCFHTKQLSAKLSSMIPKLHATYFVVAKEYVPNKSFSVERDTGIYMMRHMETYNGNKCRYTLKLLKDICRCVGSAVDFTLYHCSENDVKRYIVRVCNEILTWQDNIVKDQVTSKAKAYKNGHV
ncbi:uncharacterized protein LOC141641427 [Silene latifolia]|uniref:uncharacterized protein LOC141641427 n=1 Tax=Silene latifolia TaxID=37657 RepID=UPI003D784A09